MTKPVEFSKFYRLLNAAKDGEQEKIDQLSIFLEEYKTSDHAESALQQLGQIFIYIGLTELYQYSGTQDIQAIGLITEEEWEELANEKKCDMPPYLANSMIKYAKKNNLSKKISTKWGSKKREIDQNIMLMARYITEGILDALE